MLLALPATGGWWARQFAELTQGGNFKAQPQLTIFMPVNAPRKVGLEIAARLKALPDVRQAQFLPREETLARLARTGHLSEALAALPDNPFPDAIVVVPADESPEALERLAEAVRGWREVAHVLVDADWAQRLAALGRLAREGATLLAILFGAGALGAFWLASGIVTGAGLPVGGRLASSGLLGLGAGVLALTLVAAATLWLRPTLLHVSALYGLDFTLALPTAGSGVAFVAATTLVGGLTGLVRR